MEQVVSALRETSPHRDHEFQWIHVRDIRVFERDPRKLTNPDFNRIRESIRVRGMEQPLVVARSGERDPYVLQVGGASRLRALASLYEATGDSQYSHAPCVLRKQLSEVDAIISHLQSNQPRASLTFYERSHAVIELWRLLSTTNCCSQLSEEAFLAELHRRGLGVGQPVLLLMTYGVDRLDSLIPEALRAGLDHEAVRHVKSLESTARAVWNRLAFREGSFDPVFEELVKRFDVPDWDHASLVKALESEIAMAAEVSPEFVRVQLWQEQFPIRKCAHGVALENEGQDDLAKTTSIQSSQGFLAGGHRLCVRTLRNEPPTRCEPADRNGVRASVLRLSSTITDFRLPSSRWLDRIWERLSLITGPLDRLIAASSSLIRFEIYVLPTPMVGQLLDICVGIFSLGLRSRADS